MLKCTSVYLRKYKMKPDYELPGVLGGEEEAEERGGLGQSPNVNKLEEVKDRG